MLAEFAEDTPLCRFGGRQGCEKLRSHPGKPRHPDRSGERAPAGRRGAAGNEPTVLFSGLARRHRVRLLGAVYKVGFSDVTGRNRAVRQREAPAAHSQKRFR